MIILREYLIFNFILVCFCQIDWSNDLFPERWNTQVLFLTDSL